MYGHAMQHSLKLPSCVSQPMLPLADAFQNVLLLVPLFGQTHNQLFKTAGCSGDRAGGRSCQAPLPASLIHALLTQLDDHLQQNSCRQAALDQQGTTGMHVAHA